MTELLIVSQGWLGYLERGPVLLQLLVILVPLLLLPVATHRLPRRHPLRRRRRLWTLAAMAEGPRRRYGELGQPMVMEPDTVRPAVGPLWIWSYPIYRYQDQAPEGQVYGLSCTVMKTPLDYPIRAASGFHYCQLLSPGAAMEWICIDGLRQRASCSGRLFVYGPIAGFDKAVAYFGRSFARQTRTAGLLRRR